MKSIDTIDSNLSLHSLLIFSRITDKFLKKQGYASLNSHRIVHQCATTLQTINYIVIGINGSTCPVEPSIHHGYHVHR